MALKFFKIALPSFVVLELLSFFSHTYMVIASGIFFAVLIAVMICAFWRLEYGVYFLLAELFVGGKGHLLEFGGISIRIAVFCVIMGVWTGIMIIKKKKPAFLESKLFKFYLILSVFVFTGIVIGFLRGNGFVNIFLDANAWVYFLIVFPVFEVLKEKKHLKNILEIFLAAIAVVSLKTIGLFTLFSCSGFDLRAAQAGVADTDFIIFDIYKWARNSGAGEITLFEGFYRIFLQSQIFTAAGFFVLLWLWVEKQLSQTRANARVCDNYDYGIFILLSVVSATLLISFSRSFWVGTIAGGLVFLWFLVRRIKWRGTIKFLAKSGLASIVGVLMVVTIAPGIFNEFGNRVSAGKEEAALSSRMSLLPKLYEKIKENPILGSGFGATIIYETKDPRQSGKYETYAFEWGYLEMWFKIGFLGLLAYLFLIYQTFFSLYKNSPAQFGLICALLAICAISVSSPYLNHPLGIGAVILIGAAGQIEK